jgi:hypothetical protein
MEAKLHYFNPGHETAILFGKPNYTAPENVRKMIHDLSILPAWYADSGDYVLAEENIDPQFFNQFPKNSRPSIQILSSKGIIERNNDKLRTMIATPWGISPHSLHQFEILKKKNSLPLEIPLWKNEYTELTSRRSAAKCLDIIREILQNEQIPDTPIFISSLNELDYYLPTHEGPFVLKTPFSSSGRGLLWLNKKSLSNQQLIWINGAIKKQGCFSIEHAYNKVTDFAMEFYSDGKGNIHFEGLSTFGTNKNGAYEGNSLESQESMEKHFGEYFQQRYFNKIKEAVTKALQTIYGKTYNGFLGVDMMIYKNSDSQILIHPCIEVNMRYTIGLVALKLREKYVHKAAKGYLYIKYENQNGEALQRHLHFSQQFPPQIKDDKIRTGYFPLCPITEKTHYTAFIILE